MEAAIELIRTLAWCVTFLAVIAGILFAIYIAGFVAGEDSERERRNKTEEVAGSLLRKLTEKNTKRQKEIRDA
jgi:hypothetical protein